MGAWGVSLLQLALIGLAVSQGPEKHIKPPRRVIAPSHWCVISRTSPHQHARHTMGTVSCAEVRGSTGAFSVCVAVRRSARCGLVHDITHGRTGNVCGVDMDCPDNAFCRQSSYCVCKDGFVYAAVNSTHKGCLKEARSGEECVQHIQCHSTLGVHSECTNGVCACAITSHLEDDRCYETAVIGERCQTDMNCYLGEQGLERQAFCVRGYCSCQLQFSPRDNGTRCVRDAVLGEACEDQLQCAGPGLECRGTCRCRDRWVAHNDTNSCVESVKALNDPCEYDVQCDALAGNGDAKSPGAALCLGGQCMCAYSARAVGTPALCWHRRRPGQECKRDEECVSEEDEPGYCLSGRCTCKTCSPDARDFGGASTLSRPPVIIAAIFSVAAILRH